MVPSALVGNTINPTDASAGSASFNLIADPMENSHSDPSPSKVSLASSTITTRGALLCVTERIVIGWWRIEA
jgi:hypothetical protein